MSPQPWILLLGDIMQNSTLKTLTMSSENGFELTTIADCPKFIYQT